WVSPAARDKRLLVTALSSEIVPFDPNSFSRFFLLQDENRYSGAVTGAKRLESSRMVSKTSSANCLPGSWGSISVQRRLVKSHNTPPTIPSTIPRVMKRNVGGNDFFVGTTAASSTFTLGISFASCTLASSYC